MSKLLTCYNRGCGQKFDQDNNTNDSCTHHPGVPFFHDAYKGWTCCNKKSVDFTEFLNIKGCTNGKHSGEKPPEAEKESKGEVLIEEVLQPIIPEPLKPSSLIRPPWESAQVTLEPVVAAAFKKQIDELPAPNAVTKTEIYSTEIQIGTTCKHGGCSYTYAGTNKDKQQCTYHPGVPIFHEGMKFWSCCQRKTSDFTAFMNQVGCETGSHKWVSEEDDSKSIKCRLDWHQTATHVVVTIYAKMYHYQKSVIRLNPIRLTVCLVFPQQNNNEYNVDMELRGVVDVNKSRVQMFGTKVEITLVKAEPGSWPKLEFPRQTQSAGIGIGEAQQGLMKESVDDADSDVDLNDIEPAFSSATIKEIK